MNNNKICYPKTNPNEIGAPTVIINRITYVKSGENSTSVCYSPLVGARRKRKRRIITPVCPPICISGLGESNPIPMPTPGCTGQTQALLGGAVPAPYFNQLSGQGGSSPYVFSIVNGILPPTVSLSGDGLLSGITEIEGLFTFTVQAVDSNGCIGTQVFQINVLPV